jgi:hypothetical protein
VGAAEPAVVECDAEPASRAGDREHDAFFSSMPRYAKQPARWRLALDQFPVCRRAEFPAGREKSREFFRFSRFLRKSVSKTSFFPGICEEIPYGSSREFICARTELVPPFGPEQGIWRRIRLRQSLISDV